MVIGYPKRFQLNGYVELQYKDYHYKSTSGNSSRTNDYSHFKQRLKLDGRGFIYHPRLLVFDASIYVAYMKSLSGVDIEASDLGYDIFMTALPFRPVSLDLFASQSHYSYEARTAVLPDRTISHYGARLNINPKKLQLVRRATIRYEYWEYDTLGTSNKTKIDEYGIRVQGLLEKIRTFYTISAQSSNTSSPIYGLDSKYINVSTTTGLTKKGVKLLTSLFSSDFDYSSGDYNKELNFSADLNFPPGTRFYHDYRYIFDKTEIFYKGSVISGTRDRLTESSYNLLTGDWGYRLSERLSASLSFDYGNRKIKEQKIDPEDTISFEDKGDLTGVSAGLVYRKAVAAFNFETDYRFILKKDELRSDLTEHWFNINLRTRKLKLGTGYLTYTLIKTDSESKVFETSEDDFFEDEERISIGKRESDTIAHNFLLGIRGRGFGKTLRRALWTFEGSYFHVKSDITRPVRRFEDDVFEIIVFEKITRKSEQYSFYGQVIFPIRSTLNLNTRATYTYGKSDSISRQGFFMHAALNYLINRNLTLSGLWRARWDSIDNRSDRTTFDYEAVLEYQRGKLFCTLELYLTTADQDNLSYTGRRIFLTMKRYI